MGMKFFLGQTLEKLQKTYSIPLCLLLSSGSLGTTSAGNYKHCCSKEVRAMRARVKTTLSDVTNNSKKIVAIPLHFTS